jgi:hypothetical protein
VARRSQQRKEGGVSTATAIVQGGDSQVRGVQRRTQRVFVRVGMNGAELPLARRKSINCVKCGKRRCIPRRVWTVGLAFTCRSCHHKRDLFFRRGVTRTFLNVGEPRPAKAVSVPLSAVIPTLSVDDIRHICGDLCYPIGAAVLRPVFRYCPVVSDYEQELQTLVKRRQEQIAFDEFVEKLKRHLWRSKHDAKMRRAIVKVLAFEMSHDGLSAESAAYAQKIAKNARLKLRSLHVTLCRVRADLMAADEALAGSESEMEAAQITQK